jgi:hypothetical protein
LDRYRQDLFELRDSLFDLMWENGYSYSTPAYRSLRSAFNGSIRFAHKHHTFALWWVAFRSSDLPKSTLLEQIDSIGDEGLREALRLHYYWLGSRTMRYLFLEGPLWLIAKPLYLTLGMMRGGKRWIDRLKYSAMADETVYLGRDGAGGGDRILACP